MCAPTLFSLCKLVADTTATGSEKDNAIGPIDIHSISVGNTHVAAVLDNAVTQKDIAFGRDVFIWSRRVSLVYTRLVLTLGM